VCFYYTPIGMVDVEETSRRTSEIATRLIKRGWMIDFAPGDKGKFFRVVVNISTLPDTVVGLVEAIKSVGADYVK
jgi:glutamate decarboxylase